MSPLQRRLAAGAVAALLLALSQAAGAASQLFKCIEGGRTVYQQQACAGAAQPEPAFGMTPLAKSAATPAEATSATPRRLRSPSPASSAPATPR
jgi:hypothetical protein